MPAVRPKIVAFEDWVDGGRISMKRIIIAAALVAATSPVGMATADEIIIHRDAPVVVETPAAPRDVVIERRRPDCATTTTRRDNGLGDSTTVTRRECD